LLPIIKYKPSKSIFRRFFYFKIKKHFKNYGTLFMAIIFAKTRLFMITSDQIKDLNSRLDILRQYL